MFSSRVSTGSRLKNWKMKPTLSRRSSVRSLVVEMPESSTPSTTTEPEVGRSSPARMCIKRRLARARRAHDRHERPAREIQRHARERVDGGLALAEAAAQVDGR